MSRRITNDASPAKAEPVSPKFQEPDHLIPPHPGDAPRDFYPCPQQNTHNAPTHLGENEIEAMDEEEEDRSESGWSRTSSQVSTPSSDTTYSSGTVFSTPTASDLDTTEWANDESLNLTCLEQLRGRFETELEDPSAWTLQRIIVLSEAGSESAARETIKLWLDKVSLFTETPPGDQLQLTALIPPQPLPFCGALTWDEADELVGEERERVFGQNVAEKQKDRARVSIAFLFPEARSKGLSVGDKRRIFTVASYVAMHNLQRALGLLWVLDKEYPDTFERTRSEREWANDMSKEFMIYTVLLNPPIRRLP